MLSRNLCDQLAAATGIPQQSFGKLYRSGGLDATGYGATYVWIIGSREFWFPLAYQLERPEGFARKLGLIRKPDAGAWNLLIQAVMDAAIII